MSKPKSSSYWWLAGILTMLCCAHPAGASTWVDPDWQTMLGKSDLIVLVEVVTGGQFHAQVKAIKSFHGEAPPEPFWVDSFNDPQTNEETIERCAVNDGEHYYLFLRKRPAATEEQLERLPQTAKDKLGPEFLADWKAGEIYSAWTMTAGCFQRVGEEVAYTLHVTTYSRFRGANQSAAEFEELLKHGVAFQTEAKVNEVFLDRVHETLVNDQANPKAELGHHLMTLYLAGESRYHDALAPLAENEATAVRFSLARLLGQVNDERTKPLLLKLLKDKHSLVQGEAVRQFAKGDPGEVGPVLLGQLKSAGRQGITPRELMDPVRNTVDGGKIEIIKTLGKIKYQPAAKALLPVLETSDAYLLQVTLATLLQLENNEYVPYLQKALAKGDKQVVELIVEVTKEMKLADMRPALEAYLRDPPNENPYAWRNVVDALAIVGDDGSAQLLVQELERLLDIPHPERDDGDIVTDVIAALTLLKYAPAKPAVYRAMFYWYGVDDTLVAHPKLLALKKKLESEATQRAKAALSDLKDVDCPVLVFIENRTDLAANPQAQPKYSLLVQINAKVPRAEADNGRNEMRRAAVAKALKVPMDSVGGRWQVDENSFFVDDTDPRLNPGKVQFLAWGVSEFLAREHDATDDLFLQTLVDGGVLKKSTDGSFSPTYSPIISP